MRFLPMESKTFHQQNDYDLLYYDNLFIVVAWNQTRNNFDVFLYI